MARNLNLIKINGLKLLKSFKIFEGESWFNVGDIAYYIGGGGTLAGHCEIVNAFREGGQWFYDISLRGETFGVSEDFLDKPKTAREDYKDLIFHRKAKDKPRATVRWYRKGKFSDPEPIPVEQVNVIIPDEDLTNFLMENDAYEAYVKNTEKQKPGFIRGLKDVPKSEWLNYCFYWEDTPEGNDYWNELNDQWRRHVR